MKLDRLKLSRIIGTIVLLVINVFLLKNNILTIIAYLIISYDIIIRAIKNILSGQFLDENFLMMIATIGAIILGEYYEAVAVSLFYQVGEMFQDYAIANSRKSISELMDIKPLIANLVVNNKIIETKPEDIKINDIVLVKSGEKIPLDGIVIDGNSSLDTKSITGESLPRDVYVGDTVISGCINMTGTLTIKVTKDYQNSTVQKILELIENSTMKKTNTEKFISKFSRYYTPIIVLLAVIIAFIVPLVFKQPFLPWINKALVLLVISCPCALVISVPLGFYSGIGKSSKRGILFKGSSFMEQLVKAKTIIFDKTGTLTKGNFKVTNVYATGIEKNDLIELTAKIESMSNHPIALSILEHYGKKVDTNKIRDIEEISGYGIKAIFDDKQVIIGNSKLMDKYQIDYEKINNGTVLYVAIENEYRGYIQIEDELKDNTVRAIKELNKLGINNTIMLTGDNEITAKTISTKIGLKKYFAELLPQNKVEILENIQKQNKPVIFVGDGINDAPSLIKADIGIAMGGLGSDAAIEASDIVLMNDDIENIVAAVDISKKTLRTVKQNIVFSLSVKLIILILATFGIANMWEGIFADVGVSVLAILNSMRLLFSHK